jgi:hypothetical protein
VEERRPESYELRLERTCFCSSEYIGPYVVTVRGGQIVDVEYAPDVEHAFRPLPPVVPSTSRGSFRLSDSC